MAGLRLRTSLVRRLAAGGPHFAAGFRPRLRLVPAVRYLEALAGILGGKQSQRRPWRDDGRYRGRADGGRAGGAGPLCLPSVMFAPALLEQATEILALARAKGLRIAAAESCTGGLIAALLTAVAGSSDVFERGFVTYSNEAKEDLLGVPTDLIHQHGAVS